MASQVKEHDKYLIQIRDLFLKPILLNKHPEEENKQFLIRMFHLDTRIIDSYTVQRKIEIPGLFYVDQGTKIQGLGYRSAFQNDRLLVRIDEVLEVVDVEFFGGQGRKDQVFCLSMSEWRSIQPSLKISRRRSQSIQGIWDDMPSR